MKECSSCGATLYKRNKSGFCRSCWGMQPHIQEQRRQRMKSKWENDPDFRKLASSRSDIPVGKLDDYIFLTRTSRIKSDEARRILGIPQR